MSGCAEILHILPVELLLTNLYGSFATSISQMRKLRLREVVYVSPKLTLLATGTGGTRSQVSLAPVPRLSTAVTACRGLRGWQIAVCPAPPFSNQISPSCPHSSCVSWTAVAEWK